jgi:hypothetical protein
MTTSISTIRDKYKKRQEKAEEKTERGTYISGEGTFQVELVGAELRACLNKEKLKKGLKVKDWFGGIFTFKILDSTRPEDPKGCMRTWFVRDPQEGGLGDVERLMWALQGYNPAIIKAFKDSDPDKFENFRLQADLWGDAAFNDAEALKALGFDLGFIAGLRANLSTSMTDTSSGGKFTVHVWTPTKEAAESPVPLLSFE